MNIFFLSILIIFIIQCICGSLSVNKSDQCSKCTSMLSQSDCQNYQTGGCTWTLAANSTTNGTCGDTPPPSNPYKEYCANLETTKCATTYGCALVDSTCTHMIGCTAYKKTTLTDCQAISYLCITDGTICTDAKECSEYTETECPSTPSISGNKQCKWDTDESKCRDYKCSEGATSLTQNDQCSTWLSGCITNGYGCTSSPLGKCDSFTGDATFCSKITAADGLCELLDGATNCSAKICTNALITITSDGDCNAYQTGCVTTGQGCIDVLKSCNTYQGDATSCAKYKGIEGNCEVDDSGSTCRALKCENLTETSLPNCKLKNNTCLFNGLNCITTLQNCEQYKGTSAQCSKITGLNGNCKVTTGTTGSTVAACVPKDCATDSDTTYTSLPQCQKIQSTCVTTGKGCVAQGSLPLCNTYTSSTCLTLVGSDGKCKQSTTNASQCDKRACADIQSSSNKICSDYLDSCVSDGTNCIVAPTCENTTLKLSCDGNSSCQYNSQCLSQDCTKFTNQSLCALNLQSGTKTCIWKNDGCQLKSCTDFQGDKTICEAVSNYYCTNAVGAAATDACQDKSCSDTDTLAYTQDSNCKSYLPTCLTNGAGCIVQTATCDQYPGDSTTKCEKFTGYIASSNNRDKCWWSVGSFCTKRLCSHATGMTGTGDCTTFLDGCIYNGNGGCVDATATCLSYYGTKANCELITAKGVQCSGLTGNTSISACKVKDCTDIVIANDSNCTSFPNCVSNGTSCVSNQTACNLFSGTTTKCLSYFTSDDKKCNYLPQCLNQSCANKTDAASMGDCTSYQTNCRKPQNSQTCIVEQDNCTGYTNIGSDDTDKYTYCISVTTKSGDACGYDTTVSGTCSPKTCKLANQPECANFLGTSSCVYSTANTLCYKPDSCSNYSVPQATQTGNQSITYCNGFTSKTTSQKCTASANNSANCSDITTCEQIIDAQTNAAGCNTYLKGSACQFSVSSKCVTTKDACSSYDVTGLSGSSSPTLTAYCESLYQDASGVITQCTISGSSCGPKASIACANISSPRGQQDCGTSCYYYSSGCHDKVSDCTQVNTPGSDNAVNLTFCSQIINSSGKYCSYDSGTSSKCANSVTCASVTSPTTSTNCAFTGDDHVICSFSAAGTPCAASSNTCGSITGTPTSQADCDAQTVGCYFYGTGCHAQVTSCSTYEPADTTSTATKVSSCQYFKNTSGQYCSWTTTSDTKCTDAAADCSTLSGDASTCPTYINQKGMKCIYKSGSKCSEPIVQSQADCDKYYTSLTYNYLSQTCYDKTLDCSTITPVGADNPTKLTYCNSFTMSSKQCTYIYGATLCIASKTDCLYSFSAITSATQPDIITGCIALGCTYYDINTNKVCRATQADCASYTSGTDSLCIQIKNTAGNYCAASSTSGTCQNITCEKISSPANQGGCDTYKTGCQFLSGSPNQCLTTQQTCESYTVTNNTSCTTLKASDGTSCKAGTTSTKCATPVCSDFTLTTNTDCKAKLGSCISNGTTCLSVDTYCSNFTNMEQYCKDNFNLLTTETTCTTTGTCQDFNCNQYKGNKAACELFTGNKCTGDANQATTAACRDSTCADAATTFSQDSDCKTYLDTCLTNGAGCISKTLDCTNYKGTQATCKNFKGLSGTQYCWNTDNATSSSSCTIRKCSDNTTATSDADCKSFMYNSDNTIPTCVTTTAGCIGYDYCKNYSSLTETQCSKITAKDSPCKAVSQVGTATGSCQQRDCVEAPNTYTTDAQCKNYHSKCVTTGHGCTESTSCSVIQAQKACTDSTNTCQWVSTCFTSPSTCDSLTSQGQSICTNTVLKNGSTCAWSGTACRNYTCADLDSSYTQYTQCYTQTKTTEKCTTNGAGCVTYGICTSYLKPSICDAAQTTETEQRCTWDNSTNKCRTRQCSDNTEATLTSVCNTYLSGCITKGKGCVGPTYSCSAFSTLQYCQQNSSGTPCLLFNNVCQEYVNCKDIVKTTHDDCQAFSSLCTTDTSTCIPITACGDTQLQASCIVGTDGVCGWLPEGKCALFTKCSDVAGTDYSQCQNYSKSCVSDGTNCVDYSTCSSYLQPDSCQNSKGATDGPCTWSNDKCSQRVCGDLVSSSDTDCAAFTLNSSLGKCTTDGTNCVLQAKCSTYLEQGCFVGTDGTCLFTYPIGQTTGDKACRAKDCSDVTGGTTNAVCQAVTDLQCVTNGTNCIATNTCSNYTNKLSCNAVGSDGNCAFTPVPTTTNANAGTCKLFSACTDANNDSVACAKYSKYCIWTSTTTGTTTTTSCAAHTCTTYNTGSSCNPVPNLSSTQYTVCKSVNGVCSEADPSTLTQAACYTGSYYTYTWSITDSLCKSCSSTNNNNNSNNNSNNTDNNNNNNGFVIGISLAFFGLFL